MQTCLFIKNTSKYIYLYVLENCTSNDNVSTIQLFNYIQLKL